MKIKALNFWVIATCWCLLTWHVQILGFTAPHVIIQLLLESFTKAVVSKTSCTLREKSGTAHNTWVLEMRVGGSAQGYPTHNLQWQVSQSTGYKCFVNPTSCHWCPQALKALPEPRAWLGWSPTLPPLQLESVMGLYGHAWFSSPWFICHPSYRWHPAARFSIGMGLCFHPHSPERCHLSGALHGHHLQPRHTSSARLRHDIPSFARCISLHRGCKWLRPYLWVTRLPSCLLA